MNCANCGHKIKKMPKSDDYKYRHFFEGEPDLECQEIGCHCENPMKEEK